MRSDTGIVPGFGNDDPGYNYDNVLYYNVRGVDKVQASRSVEVISSLPEVIDVERAYTLPFDYCSGNDVYLPGHDAELFNIADQYAGTEGFFEFFDIPIIEGRVPAAENEIAVSRSFVETDRTFRLFGYESWNSDNLGSLRGLPYRTAEQNGRTSERTLYR